MTNRADVVACVKAKTETQAKKLENLQKGSTNFQSLTK